MKLMRILLVGLFALFVVACSNTPLIETPLIAESNALIKEQSKLIDDQAARLEILGESQSDILTQLASMQYQVDLVSSKLSSVIKNTKPKTEQSLSSPNTTSSPQSQSNVVNGKAVLGRVEYVWLDGAGEYVKSRIDTGAKSSVLNAKNIQRFERNGDPWVRFSMLIEEKTIAMEAPLTRHIRVRQVEEDDLDRRPVVSLMVKLGELNEETEFMLSDRSDNLYPVLLGRSFLQDIALVDVAKKFTRNRDPKLAAQANQ